MKHKKGITMKKEEREEIRRERIRKIRFDRPSEKKPREANGNEKSELEKRQEFENTKGKVIFYYFLGGLFLLPTILICLGMYPHVWPAIVPIIFYYLAIKNRRRLKKIAKEIGEIIPWWL